MLLLTPLLLAVLMVLVAPLLLTRGRWQVRNPRLALGLWLGSFLTGAASLAFVALAAVLLAVQLRVEGGASVQDSAGIVAVAWGSLFLIGAVIALVLHQGDSVQSAGRELEAEFGTISALIGYRVEAFRTAELIVLNTSAVFAYSLAGKPARIVVSTGCRELLSSAEFAAVLEHEYAHLKQRHALIMKIVALNAACSPKLSAATSLRRATALLIELIADDTAASRAGALNLSRALHKMNEAVPAASLPLRSQRVRDQIALRQRRGQAQRGYGLE